MRPSRSDIGALLAALSLSALLFPSCTTIEPGGVMRRSSVNKPEPAHDDFDRVLRKSVNDGGWVDYHGLVRDTGDLDRYYLWLSTISPDSDPDQFPTTEAQLAYWINAYNATVLETVVHYYPITSVTDVDTPFPVSLASDKAGFFFLQRIELGGETMSLYGLENSVIRDRYDEPRIHFALNCASRSCPRLPREAFVAERLDTQLDRETRRFFAEERNLEIDHQERVVELSSILDWYEGDFTSWYERTHPGEKGTLLTYAALYAPEAKGADLQRAIAESYEVRFVPYDWRLNDQRPIEVEPPEPAIGGAVETIPR